MMILMMKSCDIRYSTFSVVNLNIQFIHRFGSLIIRAILLCNDDVSSRLFGMCI